MAEEMDAKSPPPQTLTEEERRRVETIAIGGPTLFVNRHVIQPYADGGIRLIFAEQYSPDLEITPAYRTAVFMHKSTAQQLAENILAILAGEKSPSDKDPKSEN